MKDAVWRSCCQTFTILTWSRHPFPLKGAPARQRRPSSAFPSEGGSPDVLVMRDPLEVSPLSRGVMLPNGTTPIRPITGRRSLFPTSSARCAVPFPCGQDTGKVMPGRNGFTQLMIEEMYNPSHLFNISALPWAAPAVRLAGCGFCPQGFAQFRYRRCTPG